jgi:hypothetical protein
MAWVEVKEYNAAGWDSADGIDQRSREYCRLLERGEILLFREPPYILPKEDRDYLISQRQQDSRLHKNISYRPVGDVLRGLKADREVEDRVHRILRAYSSQSANFLSQFLTPYAGKVSLDYASFRPMEELNRNLPLHKRNDLLHVDAFPSRPTRGGRILRVFTNLNPNANRVWMAAQNFAEVAHGYAKQAGLERIGRSNPAGKLSGLLRLVGVSSGNRSPYDRFMLRFHDYMKENSELQKRIQANRLEFPPMSTWMVFTDGVAHAALSGQFALEQTFIVPTEALVSPQDSPIRVLEEMCHLKLA